MRIAGGSQKHPVRFDRKGPTYMNLKSMGPSISMTYSEQQIRILPELSTTLSLYKKI